MSFDLKDNLFLKSVRPLAMALPLSLLPLTAILCRGAESASPPAVDGALVTRQIADVKAAYARWDEAWRKDRALEARVARLRQEVAALQVMNALELTNEQAEKLLPLAIQARAAHRLAVAAQSEWFDEVLRRLNLFADDIAQEDLIPFRGGAKTIRGNYDRDIWNMNSLVTRHPGTMPREKMPLVSAVRKLAADAFAVLTPAQQQKLDPKKDSPIVSAVRALKGDGYVAAYNIVPMPYLGTLNTGNSVQGGADANTPFVGLLTAPNLVVSLEKRLEKPLSEPTPPREDVMAAEQLFIKLRLERDLHFRRIVSANWSKGLRVTDRQTYALLPVMTELAGHYTSAEDDYVRRGAALEQKLTQWRDLLAAGQPVPGELVKQVQDGRREFAWSYWSGPDQGGAAAEDHTFRLRACQVWTLYPEPMDKLIKSVEAVYSDSQKIVLWNVHGNCFLPWFPFTNPVGVGGEPQTEKLSPVFESLRHMTPEQFAAAIERLTDEQMKTAPRGRKLTDEQRKKDRDLVRAALTAAHDMSDAEFEANKYDLSEDIGVGGRYGQGDDLDGHRSLEQNGQWPAIDWADTTKDYWGQTCRQRLESRLEFISLPRMIPFQARRAELFLNFRPPPAADLEKL